MTWLADHWEFVVGAVIGLAGLVAAYVQRRPKTLDYRIVNKVALLSQHVSRLRQPLQLTYRGSEVADPYLVLVRIQNTGKRAIRAEDYVSPISVTYTGGTMLDAGIASQQPDVLEEWQLFDLSGSRDPAEAELVLSSRPELMNPGDWYEMQVFFNGDPGDIKVTSRFADQRRPMRNIKRHSDLTAIRSIALVGLVCLLIGAPLLAGSESGSSSRVIASIALTFIGYSVLMFWLPLFFNKNRKRVLRQVFFGALSE